MSLYTMLPSESNQRTPSSMFNNTPSTSNTLTNSNKNSDSKNTTNEINLIDFENLHIQSDTKKAQIEDIQIKIIEDFLKTSRQQKTKVNYSTSITEAEFQAFFDTHEFGKNQGPVNNLTPEDIQLLEAKSNENKQKSQLCQIAETHPTQEMVLLTTPTITSQKLEHHENLDIDDLLEEILTQKNLEKKLRVEVENLPIEKENKIPCISIAKEHGKMSKISMDCKKPNDFDNIFEKILEQNQKLRPKVDEKHFPEAKNLTETLPTNITEQSFETNIKREQKALIENLVTKFDIKYLETVKKVDKVFSKYSNLKSDAEKCKLTLGPSLYEKSVVLPQILQRLHQRDTESEVNKSMEMKLILDAAGSSFQKPSDPSQISNTDKITSVIFTNPTTLRSPINSTFPTTSNLPKIPSSSPKILKTPIIASFKPTILNQRPDVIDSMKPIVSDSDHKHTALLKRPDILSSSRVLDREIPILRPPELLMDDCNKQRLVAHRAHKLFESLVRGDFH